MTLRAITRNLAYSLSYILGLSVGLAALILIALYVQFEFSYDKNLPDSDLIYRVTTDMRWPDGQHQEVAVCMGPLPYFLNTEYPEVVGSARFFFENPILVQAINSGAGIISDGSYEEDIIVADSSLFSVFEFPMIYGNPDEILRQPDQLIITEKISQKYFGSENPIGKEMLLNARERLTISGVMCDLPENSHLKISMIRSAGSDPAFSLDNLRNISNFGYIRFQPGIDIEAFKEQIPDFESKYMGPFDDNTDIRLQKMQDIHLHNDRIYDRVVESDYKSVLIIGAIGIIILLIACINFINLTTARSAYRVREVGIRKVTGASRKQLMGQFIGEAMLITTISLFLAVVLVETFLPEFRNITETNIALDYKASIHYLIGLVLIVGGLSGVYPAFILSGFKPISLFRGFTANRKGKGGFQKTLVVIQFSITIALVISMGVILKQMHFINSQDLGYKHHDVVYIDLPSGTSANTPRVLKEKLKSHSDIEMVSTSNLMPGRVPWGDHFIPEGSENWSPHRYINVDYDYLPFFGIKLIEGRNFSADFGTDSTSLIINESTAKEFGWSLAESIGKEIKWNFASSYDNQITGEVIGVMKDFHVTSLHDKIESLIFTMNQDYNPVLAVRLAPGYNKQTLGFIKEMFKDLLPEHPFDPIFLSEEINMLYKKDHQFLQIIKYFALIAIFIATLGLIGLSTFLIQRKFKELGIRKTFGASSLQILLLLTLQFEKWVLIANLFAWPIAYFFMRNWLSQFAYKTDLSLWIFILGSLFSLTLAFLTVGYQAWKASGLKPISAIRYE